MTQSSLITFEQDPILFLGIKVTKKQLPDNKFSVRLYQQVIINNLMTEHNLSLMSITNPSLYRTGYHVDKVKLKKNHPQRVLDEAEKKYASSLDHLIG